MYGASRVPHQSYQRTLKNYHADEDQTEPNHPEMIKKIREFLAEGDRPTKELMAEIGLSGNTSALRSLEFEVYRCCPDIWEDDGMWGVNTNE